MDDYTTLSPRYEVEMMHKIIGIFFRYQQCQKRQCTSTASWSRASWSEDGGADGIKTLAGKGWLDHFNVDLPLEEGRGQGEAETEYVPTRGGCW